MIRNKKKGNLKESHLDHPARILLWGTAEVLVSLPLQSPPIRSRAKLELSLADSRNTIASLTADLTRLRKKLEVCEGDLDRSEREVDKLRRDKEEMNSDAQSLRHRVASLENQVNAVGIQSSKVYLQKC